MADDPAPHGQSITALPLIPSLPDGELADERRTKPHAEQRDFLWVFAEPLARWRNEQPSSAQRRELDRLEGQLERLRAVLSDILELAEELQQGTIERVLAKSDLELGLEALLRMTNGR